MFDKPSAQVLFRPTFRLFPFKKKYVRIKQTEFIEATHSKCKINMNTKKGGLSCINFW